MARLGTQEPVWAQRPDGSNWGEFGPTDQLGRLNLITPPRLLAGAKEVRAGLSFSLSLPLTLPGGNALNARRHPPRIVPVTRGDTFGVNYAFSRDNPRLLDVSCDDCIHAFTHYSTHWDSLAHIGARFDADGDGTPEIVYYNGFRLGDAPPDRAEDWTGAPALGVEHMAVHGVQGRGVLVDLHHHFGAERVRVGHDLLMDILNKDGIDVETGDVLCLHTGLSQVIVDMAGTPDAERLRTSHAVLDGHDDRLLDWIVRSGVSALVADNHAVEEAPRNLLDVEGDIALPLHHRCLFKQGIHLGELWYLTPLARWLRDNGRSRFFLTAPPMRLPGAVGSPVNPIASV